METSAKCFMLEPTGKVDRRLRRYAALDAKRPDVPPCPLRPGQYSLHDSSEALDVIDAAPDEKGRLTSGDLWPHDDLKWPKACGCGYVFQAADEWQLFVERLYRRADTAELLTLRNAPPGAMWYATWYEHIPEWCGPDGKALVCVCPGGGVWHIDSVASNCTRRGDKTHRCWIRHGTPPNITVDKNGNTCDAGAGSIQTDNWHGFLRNGVLA